MPIDIHADDYGLSIQTSEDILDCIRKGLLDSVSVLTNMTCFEECVHKYRTEMAAWPKKPNLTIHLNFMEGHCKAPTKNVSHLTNSRGYFSIGWKDLLIWNYSPHQYRIIKEELKAEIKAQTQAFQKAFKGYRRLRFDGHQHTQMIPIVYHALLEVIQEQKYEVEYIRVTKEPITPYLQTSSLWATYSPINFIKNILLNHYAFGMERTMKKEIPKQSLPPMYLWGVVMSGSMNIERVSVLLKPMLTKSLKKGRILEILFHPGNLQREEIGEEFSSEYALPFYLSPNRTKEKDCIAQLHRPAEN